MVHIEDHKVSPTKKIIDDIKTQIVYIPLKSRLGYLYKMTCQVGDKVSIVTILGKTTSCDLPLLSSVSGTIVGLEKKYISNGDLVDCIVIENDFKDKYLNKVGTKKDISKYSKEELLYLLTNSGITGMSGNDFPTYIKYTNTKDLKYLIVNGAECEIFCSADGALMYNNPEEILEAIDALIEILNLEKAYIAINETSTKVIKKFLKYINTYPNIKIYNLIDAYPTGSERYLVEEIIGKTYEKYPSEVNTLVDNVSTIYAIYELLKYHKPISERIVTLNGPGFKHPANYKVKIGTCLNELIMKTEPLNQLNKPCLIAGGLMMGKTIPNDNLIITKDLGCIVIDELKDEPPHECIKCGKCIEVCPMHLIPAKIIQCPEKAIKLNIKKCNSCGLCSYICPSKIEVRDKINEIKENIHE